MAKMSRQTATRTLRGAGLVALFLVSFVLFLFMTFPYEVLKETVAAELSQSTGFIIRIGDMSASLPLGVAVENLTIEPAAGGSSMTIKSLRANLSVLRIFLAQASASLEAVAGAGNLDVRVDFGIFDLISGVAFPKHFTFAAENFPLDEAIAFVLNNLANSPTANPMVAPLLSAIGISAQLSGKADFKLDVKNPVESNGQAEIALNKAVLKLSHPSLGLPDQQFKKALIKAKVDGGSVVLDKNSGFISDELELLPEGKIALKPDPAASVLDMKVVFRLNKGLKDKFGFLIDAVTGNAASEGQVTMQLRGPMAQPAVTTF